MSEWVENGIYDSSFVNCKLIIVNYKIIFLEKLIFFLVVMLVRNSLCTIIHKYVHSNFVTATTVRLDWKTIRLTIKYWVNGSFNTVQGAIEVFTIQINIEFNMVVGKALKGVIKIDSKICCVYGTLRPAMFFDHLQLCHLLGSLTLFCVQYCHWLSERFRELTPNYFGLRLNSW